MKRARLASPLLLLAFHASAFGRGVSPYLPLNLEPEMEAQIERVLILGDQAVLTRPIPAATVLDALPKACKFDQALCEQVQRYLARYTHTSGLAHASVEGASTHGADTTLPNRYGMGNKSVLAASADIYVQPSDYLLLNIGAVAYDARTDLAGSMVSLGFSFAQLDLGYRPHWLSPMTDSSMLTSTEAPTMPSLTLSNYVPLTRLGLQYEFFLARMSTSDHILYRGGFTSGHPRLGGIHFAIEPVSGWSIAFNRLVQFGGGARSNTSFSDLLRAFFNPSRYANFNDPNNPNKVENQEASFTSSFLFPAKIPFAVYAEYAGEDTSRGRSYLLGNSALSMGIHFPRLWRHFDFTYETSEWQNGWYVHEVYQDGMTNFGHVTGHWGADQRILGDGVGAQSHIVRVGWQPPFGGLLDLRYRTLQNQSYGQFPYQRFRDITLQYSRPWQQNTIGGEVEGGRDVFGNSFSRIAAFVRFGEDGGGLASSLSDSISDGEESGDKKGEIFVDAGTNTNKVRIDLTDGLYKTLAPKKTGAHFALGARRFVSEHSDLGARLELDDVQGHSLIGFRAFDYRYRFDGPLAATLFIGAARYALRLPAYGIYYGAGAQWRNVLPGWDLGIDWRYANSIARDNLLPGDPVSAIGRPDSFYDVTSWTFSVSRHF